MGVSSVSGSQYTDTYSAYTKDNTQAKTESKAAETTGSGVVYEKSQEADSKKAPYSINKMSEKDRAELVQKLKDDQVARQKSLVDIVQKMMNKQAATYSVAGGKDDDSIWKFLASGDYEVDAETKAQAQADIAEDGYWGVKQTSQRMFDFASALAGDDVEKMKKMQDAMMKGYKEATKAWGKDLPDISKDTLEAANKLFDDYYASKSE